MSTTTKTVSVSSALDEYQKALDRDGKARIAIGVTRDDVATAGLKLEKAVLDALGKDAPKPNTVSVAVLCGNVAIQVNPSICRPCFELRVLKRLD